MCVYTRALRVGTEREKETVSERMEALSLGIEHCGLTSYTVAGVCPKVGTF